MAHRPGRGGSQERGGNATGDTGVSTELGKFASRREQVPNPAEEYKLDRDIGMHKPFCDLRTP